MLCIRYQALLKLFKKELLLNKSLFRRSLTWKHCCVLMLATRDMYLLHRNVSYSLAANIMREEFE